MYIVKIASSIFFSSTGWGWGVEYNLTDGEWTPEKEGFHMYIPIPVLARIC